MIFDEFLTSRIKAIISEKGLKQKKIAETVRVQPHDFSNMLNGRKQILSIHVPLIAKALGVTMEELYSDYK